jgi:hypothetical protein
LRVIADGRRLARRARSGPLLGVPLDVLSEIEADRTPLPTDDRAFVETCRTLAKRVHSEATRLLNILRLGRMKLLESVGEPAEVYARKEEPKKP